MKASEQNRKEFYNELKTKELEVYAKQGDAEPNSDLDIVIDMAKKLRRTLPKRLNGSRRQLNRDIP